MTRKPYVGVRFGRLVAVARAPDHIQGATRLRRVMFHVKCDCGKELIVRASDLRSGNTGSCGCLSKEITSAVHRVHGMSKAGSAAYSVWMGMRKRCQSKSAPAYPRYGGRGIAVCERWQTFTNFLADMGEPPTGMELDRINNDGNYEPGNCRWTTRYVQARNRRSNVMVTLNGETKCLLDWATALNVSYRRVYWRIKQWGWEPERALATPFASRPGQSSTRRDPGPQATTPTYD